MKTIIMAIAILFAASATTLAQGNSPMKHKHKQTKMATKYTCTMDPEVVKNKPGKCPKCGMKLVPMKSKKTLTTEKTGTKA